jgi:hypothetical protein
VPVAGLQLQLVAAETNDFTTLHTFRGRVLQAKAQFQLGRLDDAKSVFEEALHVATEAKLEAEAKQAQRQRAAP